MTRAEKVAAINELRDIGITHEGISVRLGMSRSAIRNLINDPDGSKQRARRERYKGLCVECGAATTGCNGRSAAPHLCFSCSHKRQRETRRWTPESIVAAIRLFYAENGRPPHSTEWLMGKRDERFPRTSTVLRECGYWSSAVRAAGFQPAKNPTTWRRWTRGDILREITEHSLFGYAPTPATMGTREYARLYQAARTHFGSWSRACVAAGVRDSGKGNKTLVTLLSDAPVTKAA